MKTEKHRVSDVLLEVFAGMVDIISSVQLVKVIFTANMRTVR